MSVENKGMCPPLSDKAFYDLLTQNGTIFVDQVLNHYPELIKFVKHE